MLFKYSLNKELLDMAVDFDHSIKMLIKDDAVLAKHNIIIYIKQV